MDDMKSAAGAVALQNLAEVRRREMVAKLLECLPEGHVKIVVPISEPCPAFAAGIGVSGSWERIGNRTRCSKPLHTRSLRDRSEIRHRGCHGGNERAPDRVSREMLPGNDLRPFPGGSSLTSGKVAKWFKAPDSKLINAVFSVFPTLSEVIKPL